MRTKRLFSITWLNLRRDRRGFVLSTGGVAVGVAAFVFFVGLGQGVASIVRDKIFPVDTSHVKVVPQRVALGAFLGGGVLDDDAVERLALLPGVVEVHRQLELKVPAVSQYNGDFFGRRIRMGVDIIAVGVDADYFADHLPPEARFVDPGHDQWVHEHGQADEVNAVPVVVSRRLIELYNGTFAPARGLPRVGESQLIGFEFPLTIGTSFVSGPEGIPRRTAMMEVVGFSDRALLLGVTMPLETVRRWNATVAGTRGREAVGYSSVVLVADGPERVGQIIPSVRTAGFDVDQTEQKLAEEIGAAVTITTLSLSLLSFLILGLAGVSIARAAYAHVTARTREIGVMRAVGAGKTDVASIVLSESAAAGLTGGVIGIGLAILGAVTVDLAATNLVADFPFKPDSFFAFPPWLPAAAVAAALFSALAGALLPALAAARLDPVSALGGGA